MISIVGGGPGGLLLCRILQQQGVEAMIYEMEQSPNARQQGGSLDLKSESGQYALKVAGLHEEFKKLCRMEGEDMIIMDKTTQVYYKEISSGSYNPEIDRGQLRELLMKSLKQGSVQYGKHLDRIEDGPRKKLWFRDGTFVETDVVVGADGAWSKVRCALSDTKPHYSGITFVDCTIHDFDRLNLQDLVGRGMMLAMEEGQGIFAQHSSNAVRVYASVRVDEQWHKESPIARAKGEQQKQLVLDLFQGWHPDLLKLIQEAQDLVIRPIYELPVGFKWESKPGITLLGDAAHVMSPFAGEGVNLALLDACELGLVIARNQPLEKYEKRMFAYSSEAAGESKSNIDKFFAGAQASADLMRSHTSFFGIARFLFKMIVRSISQLFS
ncbi:oxidoreductase [Gorgonomyces haynaldii]|nr:oxidoreductase [Gorgonomyces haynaldii]